MNILDKISELRRQRGWSEYQLSLRSGLTQSTISSWYRKNTLPTLPSLEKICEAFGISLSQFFMDEEEQAMIVSEQENRMLRYALRLEPAQFKALNTFLETICENKER